MRELHRHKKRGTTYELLGIAEAQVSKTTENVFQADAYRPLREGDRLAVYRAEDGLRLWVRFEDEFRDGRFENVTPARKWWPDEYMDEVLPAGTFSPDDWIIGSAPGGWVIGPRDRDDALSYGLHTLQEGETFGFSWMEPRGTCTITIKADGTWSGTEPSDYTWCWEDGDSENCGESVDELVRITLDADPLKPGDEVDIDLRFCKWGDAVFRLVVEDRQAKFVPVEAEAGGGNG